MQKKHSFSLFLFSALLLFFFGINKIILGLFALGHQMRSTFFLFIPKSKFPWTIFVNEVGRSPNCLWKDFQMLRINPTQATVHVSLSVSTSILDLFAFPESGSAGILRGLRDCVKPIVEISVQHKSTILPQFAELHQWIFVMDTFYSRCSVVVGIP